MAELKYHVNPKTGIPGMCHATERPCPHGGAEIHGNSPEEAVKNFEASNANPDAAKQRNTDAKDVNNILRYRKKIKELQDQAAAAHGASRMAKAQGDTKTYEEQRAKGFELSGYAQDIRGKLKDMVSAMEDAGKGHLIPDSGNTIRVSNKAQKILLEEELLGQISDGHWENTTPHDHWKDWADSDVIVDPKNPGRNFRPIKANYQLNSSELLSIVGERMVQSVKDGGVDADYNETKMARDLKDLRTVFKTPRESITTAKVEAALDEEMAARLHGQPDPLKKLVKSNNPEVNKAMMGAGARKPEVTFNATNQGALINPSTGAGDDKLWLPGSSFAVLGRADGTGARIVSTRGTELYTDPEGELGRPIFLVKNAAKGKPAGKSDLHVLGYQSIDGKRHGWIPEKKVSHFVMDK